MTNHISQGSPKVRSEGTAHENIYLAERGGIYVEGQFSLSPPCIKNGVVERLALLSLFLVV